MKGGGGMGGGDSTRPKYTSPYVELVMWQKEGGVDALKPPPPGTLQLGSCDIHTTPTPKAYRDFSLKYGYGLNK